MAIARLQGSAIAETRDDISLADVPEHKRGQWRPVEGEKPAYNPATHTISGPVYQIEAARVLRVWTVTPRDLETVKLELTAKIDAHAESIRALYSTSFAGMAMTYQEKFAQANGVDQMGQEAANALTPEEAAQSFPIIAASIGIEAGTLWDVAQIVIGKYQQWSMLAAVIEKARLGGKKSVNDSASVEAAVSAFEAIQWPA